VDEARAESWETPGAGRSTTLKAMRISKRDGAVGAVASIRRGDRASRRTVPEGGASGNDGGWARRGSVVPSAPVGSCVSRGGGGRSELLDLEGRRFTPHTDISVIVSAAVPPSFGL